MNNLTEVVDARRRKNEALEQYRDAICDAYRNGASAYAIAKALGITIRGVLNILDRRGMRS